MTEKFVFRWAGLTPNTDNRLIFHSGTDVRKDGTFVTNGGRVLINVVLAPQLSEAAEAATAGVREQIRFEGAQYRNDIASRALKA